MPMAAAGRQAMRPRKRMTNRGPRAALDALAPYANDSRLTAYRPYWAARAGLLARVGAKAEALEAYELAIGLERDPAVRRFLQNRRIELQSSLCQAGFA